MLCAGALCMFAARPAIAGGEEQALLRVDRAAFGTQSPTNNLNDGLLDSNFTWTNALGEARSKAEILQAARSKREMPAHDSGALSARVYGQVGVIQENIGKLYVLHIWIKRSSQWKLLVDQEVSIGDPPSNGPDEAKCENPCNSVPFQPQSDDERGVISAYQAVERAVTAHDSEAWGSHIAEEFFAVTSNSDRPLDKASRMAGLDQQKVGGIAPFPLVSARMFEFGDAMVMISTQQPEGGLALHVTRVWFKRGGVWLEAYSYQTTIQGTASSRQPIRRIHK